MPSRRYNSKADDVSALEAGCMAIILVFFLGIGLGFALIFGVTIGELIK